VGWEWVRENAAARISSLRCSATEHSVLVSYRFRFVKWWSSGSYNGFVPTFQGTCYLHLQGVWIWFWSMYLWIVILEYAVRH
jgi:hypothetical protein